MTTERRAILATKSGMMILGVITKETEKSFYFREICESGSRRVKKFDPTEKLFEKGHYDGIKDIEKFIGRMR